MQNERTVKEILKKLEILDKNHKREFKSMMNG
jgi:hypothetical protein